MDRHTLPPSFNFQSKTANNMTTTMTVAQHEQAIAEINKNIEICQPNDFGKYPAHSCKEVLAMWLQLKADHEKAMHVAAMANSTCKGGFIPAKYPFCNIAEHNKAIYGI